MPVARPEPSEVRVIAHVDLDCFYVQVEQRKRPELRGKPTGVVQYNPWRGGGLIAVGYEARQFGVTRNMRGDEAKKVCPNIELIQVPVAHGKADLTQYRDAGSEVVAVLSRKGTCERASIDEVYLDITDACVASALEEQFSDDVLKSHVLGLSEIDNEAGTTVEAWFRKSVADARDRMLAIGAVIISDLRKAVLMETGFTCSAGIAHNKMLAKLASGMHKPAQQTLVPSSSVTKLLATLPIKKMKQLGGKLGDSLQSDLRVVFVGDLLQFSESKLQNLYGINTGTWLWNIARGLSGDEVKPRTLPKSHSCGKTFPGPKSLKNLAEGYKTNSDNKFPSKSCVLRYGKEKIASDAFKLFERALSDYLAQNKASPIKGGSGIWAVTSLFIGASNIWAIPSGVNPITQFFSAPASPENSFLKDKECSSPVSPSNFLNTEPSTSSDNKCAYIEMCYDLRSDTSFAGTCKDVGTSTFLVSKCEETKHLIVDPYSSTSDHNVIEEKDTFPMDYMQESDDITCTPTFGDFMNVNGQASLKLDVFDPCHRLLDLSNTDSNLEFKEQTSLETPQAVIQCSPVDLDLSSSEPPTAEFACQATNESQIRDTALVSNYKLINTDGNESQTRRKELPAEGDQQMCHSWKLRDIWDRKLSGHKQCDTPPSKQNQYLWGYKQEDIDAQILSELPEEIQEELCRSLGIKRSKKSTIGDFFKSYAQGTGSRAD
ncbi:hypothetical protein KP509_19G066100 [Ceratopteris richardii]|uniref:DNA polymerase eta n=1 Tax=Ceratopteris richardii TaxID=49495 RepID=A0A8T2SKZ3_CERRI|nr:hypothetical protein KP509_19G066100 [Ceratopteris richardii]